MPTDVAGAATAWEPSTLWTIEQADAVQARALELARSDIGLASPQPGDEEHILQAAVVGVLSAHPPEDFHLQGHVWGAGYTVPDEQYASCSTCWGDGNLDRGHAWPCPAVAPILTAFQLTRPATP